MCGLAGALINKDGLTQSTLERIKEIFVANLLANEERGSKATGAAVCGHDGSVCSIKEPVAASLFVQQERFHRFLDENISQDTVIILGHTRDPTKGTVKNIHNNHPIMVGGTVGIHNGVISNDDSIFLDLAHKNGKDTRLGSVDSEAIFALFNQIDINQELPQYIKSLKLAASQLIGSYTTLFFNKDSPTKLICLRYNNPISIHYDNYLKCLFFSSRYVFLRKTFGRVVISPGMSGQTGFIFDAAKLSKLGKTPLASFTLSG